MHALEDNVNRYLDKDNWSPVRDLVLSNQLTNGFDVRLVSLNVGGIGCSPESWSICTPSW